jgi:uncharacterized protein YndB with AHSA1/START domain
MGASTTDREITATRFFDAPRELVFQMWIDPEHIANWWGPKGFTLTIEKMEVRPGGVWQFMMHGPDGTNYPNKITYIEIAEPDRLVFLHGSGEDGESGQFQMTVDFVEAGQQTKVTAHMLFKTAAERNEVVEKFGAIDGLNSTLNKLGEYLGQM